MNDEQQLSRRRFLKRTAAAVVAGAALGSVANRRASAQAAQRTFKVALIGCGGRGTGALQQHHEAAKALNDKLGWNLQIQVVATADWFADRARNAGQRYGVPEDRCFGGPQNYRQALEAGPDIVLMGQPPAFRPVHFAAAIEAGKHVFTEKPVGVDPPGIRRMLAAGELADEKGLCVVAGTQRRHSQGYNNRWREIKDGAFGPIKAARVAWNQGAIFTNRPINPQGPDDLCRNWHVWVEMSGDHIVEQHVHNIDIATWYLDAHPISAGGFGFRARRVAGNMYDFFSVDFEYPNGVYVHSMCRQIDGCWNWVGEDFTFEHGREPGFQVQTPDPYEEPGYPGGDYVAEHAHLLWAIVTGNRINEARNVAWSTGAAIMGRESAYRGTRVTWEEMYENPDKTPELYNLTMRPSAEDFEKPDVPLLKDGEIRIPGRVAG